MVKRLAGIIRAALWGLYAIPGEELFAFELDEGEVPAEALQVTLDGVTYVVAIYEVREEAPEEEMRH